MVWFYSQIVVYVGHVGPMPERRPVRRLCLVRSALRAEYRTEIAVG